ncbi:MAG TPA: hypothetical protein VFQ93_10260 [Casimicrobiaceae bacterium]|nr:hypothetical protein [Casimicrobiaceae bacterium]
MKLDGKAARRSRSKAQQCDSVRHDVSFDVVAMQVDLHCLVSGQADDDLIALANRQHSRRGGGPFAVNSEVENPVFGETVSACHREQRGGQ